jgi:hypothetical protein
MCKDTNKSFVERLRKYLQETSNDDIDVPTDTGEIIDSLTEKDILFKTPVNTKGAAWNRAWFENFGGYADKYHDTIVLLYKNVQDRFDKDYVVYPLVFLARHCIELRLKSICRIMCIDDPNVMKKHSLLSLWHLIDKAYSGIKEEQYHNAARLIEELNNKDTKSDTFRYPIDKNNNPTRIAEFIDIDNFYNIFIKLYNFLEGIELEQQAKYNKK